MLGVSLLFALLGSKRTDAEGDENEQKEKAHSEPLWPFWPKHIIVMMIFIFYCKIEISFEFHLTPFVVKCQLHSNYCSHVIYILVLIYILTNYNSVIHVIVQRSIHRFISSVLSATYSIYSFCHW